MEIGYNVILRNTIIAMFVSRKIAAARRRVAV
jgi:hypothetical protein